MRRPQKRPVLRERAEIFSLRLSPRLIRGPDHRNPRWSQIRHNPLSGKLDVLHQRHPGLESLAGQKKALCCLGTTRTETGFSGVDGYSCAAMNRVRLSSADRMLAVAD